MVMTVTLSEQEDSILRVIAHERGKDQTEILHEAIKRYIIAFQQGHLVNDNYEALSDEELTMIAEFSFLDLDQAEVEDAYA